MLDAEDIPADEAAKDTVVEETTSQVEEPAQKEEEAAVKAEGEELPPDAAATAQKPRKQTAQERIDEITYRMREQERQTEYWKNLAMQQVQETTPAKAAPPVAQDRPQIENFETSQAYEDALFEWRDKEKEKEISAKREQEDAIVAGRRFAENAEKFKVEHPDFDMVIQSPVFTYVMRQAIFDSDEGATLAYNLGLPENRAIVNKIATLSPQQQLRELGKFEANMILKKESKKTTAAPPPIIPLSPSGASSEVKNLSDIKDNGNDASEFMKAYQAREIEKIKKRRAALGG